MQGCRHISMPHLRVALFPLSGRPLPYPVHLTGNASEIDGHALVDMLCNISTIQVRNTRLTTVTQINLRLPIVLIV